MEKNSLLIYVFYLVLGVVIYHAWFLPGVITGGDLWYFFPSMYDNHKFIPSATVFFAGNGFGGSAIPYMAINFFLSIPFFFGKVFGLSWDVLVRVFMLFPFLVLTSVSPFLLFKKIFGSTIFSIISSMIYLLNTYVLMLVSGGLVVIGMAYGLIPIIFLLVINIYKSDKYSFKYLLLLGLTAGVQSIMDVRVTYMTFLGILAFVAIRFILYTSFNSLIKKVVSIFLIPGIIAVALNSFWILPALSFGSNPLDELGVNYTTIDSVKYFSFAKFENAMSFLHPNWPENIFGKTYFLRPEFLLLPMLTFSSLFFANRRNRQVILPFAVIAIIGIFLSKGANEPFGGIYIFLFENVPGFIMFRDPTKWYMLIALSFSVLVPFTLSELVKRFKKIEKIVLVLFFIYLIYIIRPAILGKLPGTLKTSVIPQDYARFEDFLKKQEYGRVLWVPSTYRFSYFSLLHPSISSNQYFDESSPSVIASNINNQKQINMLMDSSVKYIAVPYDNRGETFLKDREYNKSEYFRTIQQLRNNPNLKEVSEFSSIKLFSIENAKDHFWISDSDVVLNYEYLHPNEYTVKLENVKKDDVLVFSETYDKAWYAEEIVDDSSSPATKISSMQYNGLNGFRLNKDGDFYVKISHRAQQLVDFGSFISIVSFFAVSILVSILWIRKNKKNEK